MVHRLKIIHLSLWNTTHTGDNMGRQTKFKDGDRHWYAIDVVRQKEYVAGHIFQRMGCETFIPTETRYRKRNRYVKAKVEVAYAALPGVVFVGFPRSPDWYRVMRMHLVNGVLSIDAKPRRIDTAEKEWIGYRAGQNDGHLVIEKVRQNRFIKALHARADVDVSVSSIHVEGKGLLRAPEVQKHMKSKKEFGQGDMVMVSEGPFRFSAGSVIQITGERAKVLLPLFGGETSIDIPLQNLEAA
jgi:transcription antitermination factor NusG